MKKTKIVLFTLLLALCTGLSAQAKFGWGVKAGANVDKMSFSKDILNTHNRCGITAGLTAEYIAPVLGLGADLSLMYTYMTTSVAGEDVNGNFIEIPLHLKYKIGIPAISSILSPYVFTGPNLAVKLDKKAFGRTRDCQWGWDLGIGLELIRHLQIGAGYTFGMNNIDKIKMFDSVGNVTKDVKVKNNYWTITAAWMF